MKNAIKCACIFCMFNKNSICTIKGGHTLDKFGMCQECNITSLVDIYTEAKKVKFFIEMKKQFDVTVGHDTSV